MALFQRKPQTSDPKGFYTVGENKTYLIVGLGNPGPEYDLTRHNAGFLVLDHFVDKSEDMEDWIVKKDLKCVLSGGRMGDNRIIAMKPGTFMNLSGEAVSAAINYYKINPKSVLVIHDDLDVSFGQLRLRIGGSDAGNNGVKSVIQHIGEDFGRLRIGIGPKKPAQIAAEDFVLQKFAPKEQAQLSNLKQEATAVITEYIFSGALPHETRSFLI